MSYARGLIFELGPLDYERLEAQSMSRLLIVCEGETERLFVEKILARHLANSGVYASPSKLKSRPGRQGGGCVSIERLALHIRNEYRNFDYLTTLVDLYGFEHADGRDKNTLEADVLRAIQEQIGDNFDARRVCLYIQQYEFEGLLFSHVPSFEWVIDAWNEKTKEELEKIRRQFDSPEDINNHPETAPSKRLKKIFAHDTYDKTEHGPLILEDIGLERIKRECPGFKNWLEWMESLGSSHHE